MIVLLSPSKRLDFELPLRTAKYSQPRMISESAKLIDVLKEMGPDGVADLMKVSDEIGALNYERFQAWSEDFGPENARQAILAFRGDVYRDIDVDHYSEEDFSFAQGCLRILSGLYGVLRPLDLMKAYRLEMHTKLANSRGKDLYEFWGEKIAEVLRGDLAENGGGSGKGVLVNLASEQYAKAARLETLGAGKIVTPVFKENKGNTYKIVAIYAKLARGTMANFIVKNRVEDVEKLKEFSEDGYRFEEGMSGEWEWVFVRG